MESANANAPQPVGPDSGFWTPEHLQIVIKQFVALAVALGMLQVGQADDISARLTAIVGAAFVVIINASALKSFFQHQFDLKALRLSRNAAVTADGKGVLP